nr:uncharacterized protein LOC100182484 [Ciona intestinalis]|eukprot:XP_002123557.1 uncharacterized protein LOC100182484 [Ciona intestinalis]
MSIMKFLFLGISVMLLLNFATALRCFTCNNVRTNRECWRRQRCPRSSNGCQNIVRLENGQLRISKGCQQLSACRSTSRQNTRLCQPTVARVLQLTSIPRDFNAPPSLCTTCCSTDSCNRNPYLQEQSRLGMRNPRDRIRWRPAQPPIRDVNVLSLSPDTALLTFSDIKNHSAEFFNIVLIPRKAVRLTPVLVSGGSLPGIRLNRRLPSGTIAFLVRGLSAGTQYRLSVISRIYSALYAQKVYHSFVTKPRRPRTLTQVATSINSVRVRVGYAQPGNGNKLDYYVLSYRRASDPPSAERRLPYFTQPGFKLIPDLDPSTEYLLSTWTVVMKRGRVVSRSQKVNLTVHTDVPGVAEAFMSDLHATNITWTFRVPYGVSRASQEMFKVKVRDDTMRRVVAETTISPDQRSFTAVGLTPQRSYTFSVKASTAGRDSVTSYVAPVTTLVRCYSCFDASSRDQCMDYVECQPGSSGCLNEIRRRTPNSAFGLSRPSMYRATLKCKQVNACNVGELQDLSQQCNPASGRRDNPPKVCRCCCEGDLCNGPGTNCGHLLGWLDPLRDPAPATPPMPVFCPDRSSLRNGLVTCTQGAEVGSTCSFSCNPGTYMVGVGSTTCFAGGQWSGDAPTCVRLDPCPVIPEREGMTTSCTNLNQAHSTCRFNCIPGFLLAGAPVLRCSTTATWDRSFPVCIQADDCRPNPCQNNAVCRDLTNDFECECVAGFTGKRCDQEVICEPLAVPDHGVLQCTNGSNYQSRCRYACEEGYEQHGSTYTRCMPDGYWSSFEPTLCVTKNCPVPPQILVNGGRTNCTGYRYGDNCTFTCPNGLVIAGGPTQMTCQSDSTWSSQPPCCDLKCPPHALVDLMFLLDSSSSVGRSNWNLLINFTVALLDKFVISPDDMRVGVARFNRHFDRDSEILIGNYSNISELRQKLRRMPYRGRGTLTGNALWHMNNHSLHAPGNRPGVPDVIVVITDGLASDEVLRAANALKEQDVKMYVVGLINRMNRMNLAQLQDISSGTEYLQIIDNGYERLADELSDTLTQDVCWLPCQFKYQQREIILRNRQRAAMKQDREDEDFWARVDATGSIEEAVAQTRAPRGGKDQESPLLLRRCRE